MHELSGKRPPRDAPVVLAAHGITANGYWWLPLARELRGRGSDVRLLAVCLRGRADSSAVGGPYGLNAHARDLIEVSTVLDVRPVLLGHSMGAFVAALALAGCSDQFRGAVLADGGLQMPTPGGVDRDAAARRVLRPVLRRLEARFPDEDAYVADWGSHPALRSLMTGPDAGLLRSAALHDAVPAARRGLYDEPAGFYDEARLAALAPAGLRTTCVEEANHPREWPEIAVMTPR